MGYVMRDEEMTIEQLRDGLAAERQEREQLEKELEDALWRANAAERAKESFMANITHELHTPLSAMLGFTELMREDIRNEYYEAVEADLTKIIQAGMQLLSRINELLDLSKLEADKMQVHVGPFMVRPEIERVQEQLNELFVEQANQLVIDIEESIELMVGDADKVRQILFNLLDNANKFTIEGKITLRLSRLTVEGVPGIKFEVIDTGIGIAPEHLERIFKAFTQADASATRHYEGMGLGLHICQQLCRLMGGEIRVESEPGKGSNFRFWLPEALAVDGG